MGSWVNQAASIWKYCAESGLHIIGQNSFYIIYVYTIYGYVFFNIIQTKKSIQTSDTTHKVSGIYIIKTMLLLVLQAKIAQTYIQIHFHA